MKLMLIILSNEDVENVTNALLKNKYFVTKLSTTGGVLHSGNTTLLLGLEDNKVEDVKEIVAVSAKSRKKKVSSVEPTDQNVFSFLPASVKVNGATIFVLNVDEYHKL